jgi:hypothetical protein
MVDGVKADLFPFFDAIPVSTYLDWQTGIRSGPCTYGGDLSCENRRRDFHGVQGHIERPARHPGGTVRCYFSVIKMYVCSTAPEFICS